MEIQFKDPYYRLFKSGKWFRKSCYSCPFSGKERVTDFTIGDFWNVERLSDDFGRGRRISVLLVNKEHGKELLKLVAGDVEMVDISWKIAAEGNLNLTEPTKKPDIYKEYGDVTDFGEFFDKEYFGILDQGKYLFNQPPLETRRT